jgi:hypothetical protein
LAAVKRPTSVERNNSIVSILEQSAAERAWSQGEQSSWKYLSLLRTHGDRERFLVHAWSLSRYPPQPSGDTCYFEAFCPIVLALLFEHFPPVLVTGWILYLPPPPHYVLPQGRHHVQVSSESPLGPQSVRFHRYLL